MIRTVFGGYLIAAIALVACPPSPVPPDGGVDAGPPSPEIDAAPPVEAGTSPCALACANLAAIGCKEGLAPSCTTACEHAQEARITDLHPACLAAAKTKASARACRSVACP
jgi:hypothetical protein